METCTNMFELQIENNVSQSTWIMIDKESDDIEEIHLIKTRLQN